MILKTSHDYGRFRAAGTAAMEKLAECSDRLNQGATFFGSERFYTERDCELDHLPSVLSLYTGIGFPN